MLLDASEKEQFHLDLQLAQVCLANYHNNPKYWDRQT